MRTLSLRRPSSGWRETEGNHERTELRVSRFFRTAASLVSRATGARHSLLTLNEIVSRHEALRTTFSAGPDGPTQVIARSLTIEVPVLDLTAVAVSERETAVATLAREEARRPFDISAGPLNRATN